MMGEALEMNVWGWREGIKVGAGTSFVTWRNEFGIPKIQDCKTHPGQCDPRPTKNAALGEAAFFVTGAGNAAIIKLRLTDQ
jgi:hypothetical protein